MSTPTKLTYYKLNDNASVFYDSKTQLKVTRYVPGKTDQIGNLTKEAARGGHIIKISENEYNEMMKLLPEETHKAVHQDMTVLKSEVPKKLEKKKVEEVDDETDEEDEMEDDDETDSVKEALDKRIDALGLKSKEAKKVKAMSIEEIEDYLLEKE